MYDSKHWLKMAKDNSKLSTDELLDLLGKVDTQVKFHWGEIMRLTSSMSLINTELHIRGRELE